MLHNGEVLRTMPLFIIEQIVNNIYICRLLLAHNIGLWDLKDWFKTIKVLVYRTLEERQGIQPILSSWEC